MVGWLHEAVGPSPHRGLHTAALTPPQPRLQLARCHPWSPEGRWGGSLIPGRGLAPCQEPPNQELEGSCGWPPRAQTA